MKSFISFSYTSFGFFCAPKRAFDDLLAYYKQNILTLGFTLSLLARFAWAVGQGVEQNWGIQTVIASIIAGYLGHFLFVSIILSLMSFFNEHVNMKDFWGLYFASDIPLALILPFALCGILSPFSLTPLFWLTNFWVFILKLLLIQKCLHTNLSKAIILFVAPILLALVWLISNGVVWTEALQTTIIF